MFIFTTCQIGAEPALKKEIAAAHRDLRFAYSRPGFLTFKSPVDLPPDFELRSIFARAYGVSIGKAVEPTEVFEAAKKLSERHSGQFRLHVWERDAHVAGEEPKGFVADQVREETLRALRGSADFAKYFTESEVAQPGDWTVDLICLETGSWWIGFHQHSPFHSPWPGGKPPISLPEEAPSRAYLKLEEALLWSGAPMKKGDTAIEIGSAPGGASYAMLERGIKVIGIDPGEMDSSVLRRGRDAFVHLAKPAAQVERRELPPAVQWILLDMNVAPVIALNTVERMVPWYSESLLGVILTLKLNEWKFADEIPKLLRRVEKMGMTRIRTRQLAHNKQEICVVGLTRKKWN